MEEVRKRIRGLSRAQLELLALNLYRHRLDQPQASNEPVAIVGVGCRLPGGITDLSSFEKLLFDGIDPVTDGLTYADGAPISAGILECYKNFDARFFEITPREAKTLDPHQRLLLECSWEALEHASAAGMDAARKQIGVFMGIAGSDWSRHLMYDRNAVSEHAATGGATSIAAGRIAYFLGANGPAFTVDTACSSSLVAMYLACESLRKKEITLALAGGVNLILGPWTTQACMAAGMLSRSGRCKAFDNSADGYVRSEGCVVYALKRLDTARGDGDTIYGVIRGAMVNQDGRSPGLTAPSGISQQAVINGALKQAGVSAKEVDYVETHGTGTPLGDPIEINAIQNTYGCNRASRTPLIIGSVKSNIGHTETVAGAAGLLKILIALKHEYIPANLHFQRPNRHIPWHKFSIEVASSPYPWRKGAKRRIAGISSFGFSGTNIHMIIEEGPEFPREVNRMERPVHLLTLSSKTKGALKGLSEKYARYLNQHQNNSIADICFTANTGRMHFPLRSVFVVKNHEDLKKQLQSAVQEKGSATLTGGRAKRKKIRIGFLFTGQGAQYAGMGKAMYLADPQFKSHIEYCSKHLKPQFGFTLEELMWGEKQHLLQQTRYTQPALYVLQTGLKKYLERCGITPEIVLGHSVGEFAAAHSAGVFTLETGLGLIASRATMMWDLCPQGGMLVVFDAAGRIQAFVDANKDKISIAAFNSSRQTVVAGDPATLDLLAEKLEEKKVRTQRLKVSHGFHSVHMDPMLEPYARIVEKAELHSPQLNFFSTVSARPECERLAETAYWVDHIQSPVNYQAAITGMVDAGVDVLLEIGPGTTLTALGQLSVTKPDTLWLNSQMATKEWETILNAIAQLYVLGFPIDWKGFDAPYLRRRIPLPTYPFQRKRFWLDNDMLDITKPPGFEETPILRSLYTVQWESVAVESRQNTTSHQGRFLMIEQGNSGWTPLIQALKDRGHQVVRLFLATDAASDALEPSWNPADHKALKSFLDAEGYFDAVLFCADMESGSTNTEDTEVLASYDRIVHTSMGLIGFLRTYYDTEGNLPIGRLYALTAGAQAVTGRDSVSISGAVLWGLGKTASLEYAQIWGGMLDLPLSPEPSDFETLISDLCLPDSQEDQVAYRNGAKLVARLMPEEEKLKTHPKVTSNHTYLITGGLGGIGLASAKQLTNLGAMSLCLLSRRGENALTDNENRSTRQAIAQLRKKGVAVEIIAADIADAASMQRLFKQLKQAKLPLGGVIHAAGVESAAPLHELSLDRLNTAVKAKTIGTWLLHRHTANLPSVDFFICCASISGVWGSAMLGAYSAGNHALDAICAHRASLGLPALSISWGPWRDVGMATGASGRYLIEAGLHPIRANAAAQTMLALTAGKISHCVVAEADWDRFIPLMEVRRSRPLFTHIKAQTVSAKQTDTAIPDSALIEELSNLSQPQRHSVVQARVRSEISIIFGFETPADLPVDSPLHEIGADSIQAIAVKKALDLMCGITLPTTLIFDYPTVDDITRFICNTLFNEPGKASPAVVENQSDDRHAPIAVIGIGCRFPGESDSPEDYWNFLAQGGNGIVDRPEERMDIETFWAEGTPQSDKAYSLSTGLVKNIEAFDAAFFNISPREAKTLDPQQRMMLETTWAALENAGYAPDRLSQSPTGVYFGVAANDYLGLCQGDKCLADSVSHFATGNNLNVIAGRVSYVLGLRGPSMAVDTACSSSLVALHSACLGLRSGDCDMAVAGGVNAICTALGHVMLCQSQMLSPTGRCHTFDAAADGYVRGEGAGVVVLKRLSDARRDGDSILAIVRASAVNQDGRSSSLTAPNGPAQQEVMRKALAMADLSPKDVDFVETHGTGTILGDPIELNALDAVYGGASGRKKPLVLGAVKTNLGHLESASGIAGFIKLVLAFQHEAIPPNLNFRTWNPNTEIKRENFNIPTALMPWQRNEKPRLAAVSSFGFSGTNAHVIVEEAPLVNTESSAADGTERPDHILTLSAKSSASLAALTIQYRDRLMHCKASARDIAYSANTGRSHFGHRLALIGDDTIHWTRSLDQIAKGDLPENGYRAEVTRTPRIGFLFTGQGAQYPAMGKALYDADPQFAAHIKQCSEILQPRFGFAIEELFWGEKKNLLQQTRYTQPALYVLQTGIVKLLRRCGIIPEAVLGHSVGEFAAAYEAGVISLEQGLQLITARGALMWEHCPQGGMLVVFDAPGRVQPFVNEHCSRVSIAGYNGPRNTVVSGEPEILDQLTADLTARRIKAHRLRVSHGFHSVQMQSMLAPFAAAIAEIEFKSPRHTFISTVTAKTEREKLTETGYWVDHVQKPVNFNAAMVAMVGAGVDVLLEIGPGATLTTLGQLCVDAPDLLWLNSQIPEKEWDTLLHTIARLYVQGVQIDWTGFDAPYKRRRIHLPSYQFNRKRFWPEIITNNDTIDDLQVVEALSDSEIDNLLADVTPE